MKRRLSLCLLSLAVAVTALRAASSEGYFRQIMGFLQDAYIDSERLSDTAPMLRQALRALENAADEIMVEEIKEPRGTTYRIILDDQTQSVLERDVKTPDDLWRALERIMAFVERNYRGPAEIDDLKYAMANGMTMALDPHTNVFSPKQYKEFFVHIEGEIHGIGAYIGERDGKLTIISPLKGSPAAMAGVVAGDEIVRIDDESTVSMTTPEAVARIRGERGTKVQLVLRRKGVDDPIKLSIARDTIQIKSVDSLLLDGKIGYLKVINFAQNTQESFVEHLGKLTEAAGGALRGVILDVRDNPGGLLDQAAALADDFLTKGPIVLTAHKGLIFKPMEAKDDGIEPRCPIVVLVNQGSASGSEILAGALRNNNRALLLGQATFGKGSVQQPRELRDASCLKLTVYEYLLPDPDRSAAARGGVSIQNVGVVPDIELVPAIIEKDEISVFGEDRAMRERLHGMALTSKFARQETPSARLVYYMDVPDDPIDAQAAARSFVEGSFDLKSPEFVPVHLARRIIERADPAKPFDRLEFLATHQAEVQQLKEERFAEIVEKLKEKGIDWREGPAAAEPRLEVTVSYDVRTVDPKEGKGQEAVSEEGDVETDNLTPKRQVVLQATVKNAGSAPVYRLYGITETDDVASIYGDREFLFGAIEPGAEVTRTVTVSVPFFSVPREDLVALALRAQGSRAPSRGATRVSASASGSTAEAGAPLKRTEFRVKVPTAEAPRLSVRMELLAKDGARAANLEVGQEYRVRCAVKNGGAARIYQALARLKNETEPSQAVFMVRGREVLAMLEPGDERTVEFAFQVRKLPEEGPYKFNLDVVETTSSQGLSKQFEFSGPSGKGFEPVELVPPKVEAQAAALITDAETVKIDATIEDDRDLRFFMILTVSRDAAHIDTYPDKVFFKHASGKGPVTFSTSVSLQIGTNLVSVVATDGQELKTISSFLIKRRPAEKQVASPTPVSKSE